MKEILTCSFKRSWLLLIKNEQLIAISHENSKIHVENLETEIKRKDNIIHQLLPLLQKITAKNTRQHQSLKYSQSNEPTRNVVLQKLEVPSQKRKVI